MLAAASQPLRFVAIFAGCFLFAIGAWTTPPAQVVAGRFSQCLVGISSSLIHVCGGKAERSGATLRAPTAGFAVEMRDGCNGVNVTFLLWAAVLAFPARWTMKALGLFVGSVIIQAFNLVRFISLFYLGQYSLSWFAFAHGYLWETLLILDTLVIFWWWVDRVSRPAAAPDAAQDAAQ
jgi:exosortase H (IPTLxxWG-CTERM-specific)